MTRFEDLIWHSKCAEEALLLQPCLADELSEEEIEKIRYDSIFRKFNIVPSRAKIMREALLTTQKVKFEEALQKNSPSKMLTYAIFSGDLHL